MSFDTAAGTRGTRQPPGFALRWGNKLMTRRIPRQQPAADPGDPPPAQGHVDRDQADRHLRGEGVQPEPERTLQRDDAQLGQRDRRPPREVVPAGEAGEAVEDPPTPGTLG